MKTFLYSIIITASALVVSACSSDENSDWSDNYMNWPLQSTSSIECFNSVKGFPQKGIPIDNQILVIHSDKDLSNRYLSALSDDGDRVELSSMYSDIDWSKKSLVLIATQYYDEFFNLKQSQVAVFHSDGKYVLDIRPTIEWVSRGAGAYATGIIIDSPDVTDQNIAVIEQISVLDNGIVYGDRPHNWIKTIK